MGNLVAFVRGRIHTLGAHAFEKSCWWDAWRGSPGTLLSVGRESPKTGAKSKKIPEINSPRHHQERIIPKAVVIHGNSLSEA
jgi:hypothetical protein